MLNLERQQRLVEFARQRAFRRQEEVLGHLHGNGRCTGFGLTGNQVAGGCAQHAHVVDAAMLIKALIFSGHDRLLHQLRHFLDFGERTTLFAKLANLHAISGVDAQGDFRTVIGQHCQIRQFRVGHSHRKAQQTDGNHRQGQTQGNHTKQDASQHGQGQHRNKERRL